MSAAAKPIRFEAEKDVTLHCIEWRKKSGATDAAPVILLHGGGANAHWWDHLAGELAAKNPVYALDFRGHGDSSYPDEHRVGAFSDDLEALIRQLGRQDVWLIGHSLGAAVALDHASRFPDTRGLVLVDLARGSGTGSRRRARLALSLRRTYRSAAEAAERFRFLPESSHAEESLRHSIATQSIKEEPDGRFGYKFDPAWFGLPSKPRPDLTAIECPTLLVRGEESALLSAESASEFIAQIHNGQLVSVARAGHHVLIDQPTALLRHLQEFIR